MTEMPAAQPQLTLFDVVERVQGAAAWGDLLDAGTGVQSARWISRLSTTRWTAVSADPDHLAETHRAIGAAMRTQDRLVLGTWKNPGLLAGETYDTVLADYLLGAIEGYAPYFQHDLFGRLRPIVRGRLYVTGIDPYVVGDAEGEAATVVQAIGRLRDACALLAGVTPYREYPAEWVLSRLEQTRFRVVFAKRFPNVYGMSWVDGQLADTRTLIERISDTDLSRALTERAASLRQKASDVCNRNGGLAHGHDYVIAADAI